MNQEFYELEVLKTKKNVPTLIRVFGHKYALVHKDQFRGKGKKVEK